MNILAEPMIPIAARRFGSWRLALERQALAGDELAARYTEAASGWQQRLARMSVGDTYASWVREVAGAGLMLDQDEAIRVLDAGIGTGEMTMALVGATRTPPKLHGLDCSPAMLDQVRARMTQIGLCPELLVGDLRHLPYDPASFDLVMAAHVIEHLPDPLCGLESLGRVLRPGGLIMVALTRSNLAGRLIQWCWRTHRFDRAGAQLLLEGAGFEDVQHWQSTQRGWGEQLSVLMTARKPVRKAI